MLKITQNRGFQLTLGVYVLSVQFSSMCSCDNVNPGSFDQFQIEGAAAHSAEIAIFRGDEYLLLSEYDDMVLGYVPTVAVAKIIGFLAGFADVIPSEGTNQVIVDYVRQVAAR